MQKINVFLPLLILTSFYLQAAPQVAVNTAPAAPQPAGAVTPPDTATAGQEQIVRALQDDITFERQKRQLSNELALEKLRAELQKVRGENAPAVATMPVAPPPVAMPVRDEPSAPVPRRSAPPSVVLVSQVAGVSRVGVSVNGQLQFVSRSEKFSANGKHYRLVPAKNNQFIVREVK
ncbi:lngG [Salmonella enterica subsp. enterica serovar Newport]|nr:lngG [Salmonella enterica subsp. enterica serovar Newport]EHS5152823.1 lngG [Salmonella enterica subsp. enterica serovar Newport]EHV5816193.1 lngG [Salmonella enterica subsp. enterica serovar Newport]EIC3608366.1 lngG [Salmonella enterica subsp. enterica serovar Newport]EJB3598480.1 lngG [Salmonella enterica subsp. enterica serovar Newport]